MNRLYYLGPWYKVLFLERKLIEQNFKYFRYELINNVLYYIHVGTRQHKNEIEGSENTTLRRSLERAYLYYIA